MINKKYEPKLFEHLIQDFWRKNNYFKTFDLNKKTYSILMPPPNITGKLHIGHALDLYQPDTLLRYKLMEGFEVHWFTGMDHAGIATQIKVQEMLKNNFDKDISDYSREQFVDEIWKWKDHFEGKIVEQWDKLGLSVEYDNIKFTLDKDVNNFVIESFIKLYKMGYIYRSKKLINLDTKLNTVISNIETDRKKVFPKLYLVKFKVEDKSIEAFIIKPEHLLDSEIITLANTKHNKLFENKFAINPITNKPIKLILSKINKNFNEIISPTYSEDMEKICKNNKQDLVNLFDKEGKNIVTVIEEYNNLPILDARKLIIEKLTNFEVLSIIEKSKNDFLELELITSQRTKTPILKYYSNQWFLRISKISELIIGKSKSKSTNFVPKNFEKSYFNWIEKTEDWCISRQLYWGHRLPIWFDKTGNFEVSKTKPKSDGVWTQSDDVLDTWYSSSLWPIIYKNNDILKRSDNPNYLVDFLFTGYDLILFWISKMIFQSDVLGELETFNTISIHGLIRDKDGRKMSKSLGNGVDPMELINEWGSDTLRLFLLGNSSPGSDILYNQDKLRDSWRQLNKLYNISILVEKLYHLGITPKNNNQNLLDIEMPRVNLLFEYKFNHLIDLVNNHIINNISVIYDEIKDFIFWFGNVYLEIMKNCINSPDYVSSNLVENLYKNFKRTIVLLHPFMPFITEEIYKDLYKEKTSILKESYPKIKLPNIDVRVIKKNNNRFNSLLKLLLSTKDYKLKDILFYFSGGEANAFNLERRLGFTDILELQKYDRTLKMATLDFQKIKVKKAIITFIEDLGIVFKYPEKGTMKIIITSGWNYLFNDDKNTITFLENIIVHNKIKLTSEQKLHIKSIISSLDVNANYQKNKEMSQNWK